VGDSHGGWSACIAMTNSLRKRLIVPDHIVPIDRSNPHTRGMYVDISPRYGYSEIINGHSGAPENVARNNTSKGSAFDLSGSDSVIDFGAHPEYQNTGDCTILVNASFDAIPDSYQAFTAVNSSGEAEEDNYLIFFAIKSDKTLQVFWEQGAGGNVSYITSASVGANAGEVHQYALTRSVGATSSGAFYFDGEELETYSGLTNTSGGTNSSLLVGTDYLSGGVWNKPFDGKIIGIRYFDRVLSAYEIKDYSNNWSLCYKKINARVYVPASVVAASTLIYKTNPMKQHLVR